MRRRHQGTSLLEIALALIVLSLVYVSAMPWITRQQDAVAAKSVSTDHTQFAAAARAYFEANRAAFVTAMKDGTGADKLCLVNVDPTSGIGTPTYAASLHRCAIDASFLQQRAALPATASGTNAYGESWVAVFRLVYDGASPPQPTGGVETWITSAALGGASPISAAPYPYDRAATAAGFLEGNGGVVADKDRSTCISSTSANRFEACGAGWRVDLKNFLTSDELAQFAARLNN